MFASTNLVLELGIVLWLLIGWQFAAAEFIGGAIMIALLALVLPRVVPNAQQTAARDALTGAIASDDDTHAGHDDPAAHTSGSWCTRIGSVSGWADAAGYTISDLTMLRKELVIGFAVAGFADVAVPVSFWRSLFLTGHGFWSVLENVILGPFLAIISFVCSIGNVPLAAALWSGGIAFGGTVAFVFADLITLPLLLIYRRYYGTRLTIKLLAVFWVTMSAAGLATEYLFRWAGIAPAARTAQSQVRMPAATARSITSAAQDAATTSPRTRPAAQNTLTTNAVPGTGYQPARAAVAPAPGTAAGIPAVATASRAPARVSWLSWQIPGAGSIVTALPGRRSRPGTD